MLSQVERSLRQPFESLLAGHSGTYAYLYDIGHLNTIPYSSYYWRPYPRLPDTPTPMGPFSASTHAPRARVREVLQSENTNGRHH